MLTKVGFTEQATEKTLTAEAIGPDRIRFFLLNRASEERMHVEIDAEEAKLLALFLQGTFGVAFQREDPRQQMISTILKWIERTEQELEKDEAMAFTRKRQITRHSVLMDDIKELCKKQIEE